MFIAAVVCIVYLWQCRPGNSGNISASIVVAVVISDASLCQDYVSIYQTCEGCSDMKEGFMRKQN